MTAASNLAGAAAAINAAWRNGDRVLVNGEVVHTPTARKARETATRSSSCVSTSKRTVGRGHQR